MPDEVQHDRRWLLGVAALTVAGGESVVAAAQSLAQPTKSAPLGPVRQIDAGVLNVGYVEVGPADRQPVVLLHGWPYDIQSYAEVAPLLAAAGYRVIVPY